MNPLSKLNNLLELIQAYNLAKEKLEEAEKECQRIKFHYNSNALEVFDSTHLEPYIESKLGEKPKHQDGVINSVKNALRTRNSYSVKLKQYKKNRQSIENEYYKEYAEERQKIIDTEKQKQEDAFKTASDIFERLKSPYQQAKEQLELDMTVSGKFKSEDTVKELILYFTEGRVTSMKEAINLWYDEKRKDEQEELEAEHRATMEEYAKRQCEATEDAAESARQAAESASEAAEEARRAREAAQEAVDAVQRESY